MLETLDLFWYEMWRADPIVWCIAALMATIAAFMLHSYSDNTLLSTLGALAMFVAIIVAQTAFYIMGVGFVGNKSANAAVVAGIAVCATAVVWAIVFRILTAIGDTTNKLKGDEPSQFV